MRLTREGAPLHFEAKIRTDKCRKVETLTLPFMTWPFMMAGKVCTIFILTFKFAVHGINKIGRKSKQRKHFTKMSRIYDDKEQLFNVVRSKPR